MEPVRYELCAKKGPKKGPSSDFSISRLSNSEHEPAKVTVLRKTAIAAFFQWLER